MHFIGHIDEERRELSLIETRSGSTTSGLKPAKLKCVRKIRHDLRSLRVTSIDSEKRRLTCPTHRLFGLHLTSNDGYRKLLFPSHEELLTAVDLLTRVG